MGLVGIFASTMAWLSTKTSVNTVNKLSGSSDGAYFAYGNGDKQDDPSTADFEEGPYGIETARQLYNLAWLQYLGYFNKIDENTGKYKQYYFELNADIDMTGWVLPPIGTTANPFIGAFDGQGHSVTNLVTSNNFTDITNSKKMPSRIRANTSTYVTNGILNDCNIIGMFGVVGALDEDATDATLKYNSSIISLTNYDISGASIKNATSAVLIGVAAGYVNGAMSDVGVVGSSVTSNGATSLASTYSKFNDVSSYSVVGYCADKYMAKTNGSTATAYNAKYNNEEYIAQDYGEEIGWGGSIDMKTMYNGILGPWQTYSNNAAGIPEYPTKATINYDRYGQIVGDIQYSNYVDIPDQSGAWRNGSYTNLRYYQYEQKDGNYVTSSYTFAHRHDEDGTGLDQFMYLYGDTTNTVSGATIENTHNYKDPTVYISKTVENDATYFFRYSGEITYATEEQDATPLAYGESGYLYFKIGDTKYYLFRSGNSLEVTTYEENASVFAPDTDNFCFYTIDENNGTKYFLGFDTDTQDWVFDVDRVEKFIHFGSHYLSVGQQYNGQRYYVADSEAANAPYWTVPNNGYSGTISCLYNENTYYLELNNNQLYLNRNSNNATTWFVSEDGTTICDNSSKEYYISYNEDWGVFTRNFLGYTISDGNGHYLSVSGTSIIDTNKANATIWTKESNKYYVRVGNNNYYISYMDTSPYITLSINVGDAFTQSGNTLRYRTGWFLISFYNYVQYSGGWISGDSSVNLTINEAYADPKTVNINIETRECDKTTIISDAGGYIDRQVVETTTASYTTKPTYFPLRQEETNNTPNGIPMDTNTGYVISGANDTIGDIRVSKYGSNYLTNRLSIINTVNDSGNIVIYNPSDNIDLSGNYEKFTDSRNSLQSVFNEDPSYIYGLHFVNAELDYGTNKSVYAQKAIINKETYTNYELPRDCIDFNLKEKGYINFIAGTYYSGSDNCFCSIHDVQRNGEAIASVKEIIEIYAPKNPAYSYIYKYRDETYSVGYKIKDGKKVLVTDETQQYVPGIPTDSLDTTNYHSVPVFKTSWTKINSLTSYRAYYFEIPMNEGEYALSAINGGDGAYMMYLDIGANAKKVNRSQIIEKFYEIKGVFSYPKGVGIILAAGNTVSDTNSYCVCLDSRYNGTLTLSKVQNGDVEEGRYTGSGDGDGESSLSYKYPLLTVRTADGGEKKSAEMTSYTEITTTRLTFYDYGVNDGSLNKIVVTDVNTVVHNEDGTTNATNTRTIKKYKNVVINANGTETMEEDDTLPIYIWYTIDGKKVIIDCTNTTKYSQGTNLITYSTSENTTEILSFTTSYPDGSAITVDFRLSVTASTPTAGHNVYTPSGYTVTITITDEHGNATDLTAKCQITYVKNNDGTYTYTITVNGTSAVGTGALTTPIVITIPKA